MIQIQQFSVIPENVKINSILPTSIIIKNTSTDKANSIQLISEKLICTPEFFHLQPKQDISIKLQLKKKCFSKQQQMAQINLKNEVQDQIIEVTVAGIQRGVSNIRISQEDLLQLQRNNFSIQIPSMNINKTLSGNFKVDLLVSPQMSSKHIRSSSKKLFPIRLSSRPNHSRNSISDINSDILYELNSNSSLSGSLNLNNQISQQDQYSQFQPSISHYKVSNPQEHDRFIIKDLDNGQTIDVRKNQFELEEITERATTFSHKEIEDNQLNDLVWDDFFQSIDRSHVQMLDFCQNGDIEGLKKLKNNDGFEISINKKGMDNWICLHFACNEGNLQIVLFLIENKSEINAQTSFGWTPLHMASIRGYREICELLVRNRCSLDIQDKEFNTALHYASMYGFDEIIKFLINSGASLDIQNCQQNTPQQCAFDSETYNLFSNFQSDVYTPSRQEKQNFGYFFNLDDCSSNEGNYEYQNDSIFEEVKEQDDFFKDKQQSPTVKKQLFTQFNSKISKISSQSAIEQYQRTQFKGYIMKNSRSDHVARLLMLTQINNLVQQKARKEIQASTLSYNKAIDQRQQKLSDTTDEKTSKQIINLNPTKQKKTKQQPIFQNKTWISKIEIFLDDKNAINKVNRLGPENFIILDQIGKGAFGQVYLVQLKNTDKVYAMKTLDKDRFISKNLIKYAQTERNILKIMQHPFIVKLNFAFQTKNKLYLVMDYCSGGDLNTLIETRIKLPENLAKIYTCEIVLALEALHSQLIIFRDLKPSNIVIDNDGHALLTDFGLSKEGIQHKLKTSSFCGSLAYLAPEMIEKQGHGHSIDWYLLGVTIFEMVTGLPPFYCDSKQQIIKNIRNDQPKFPSQMSQNLKSLLSQLLEKNPEKRLGYKGASQIKQHPFFKDINWNDVYQRNLKPPPPFSLNKQIQFRRNEDINITMSISQNDYMDTERYVPEWSFLGEN